MAPNELLARLIILYIDPHPTQFIQVKTMKKTLILPAVLLCISSIGLLSALVRTQHPEPESAAVVPADTPEATISAALESTITTETATTPDTEFKLFLALFKPASFPYGISKETMLAELAPPVIVENMENTPPPPIIEEISEEEAAANRKHSEQQAQLVKLMKKYIPIGNFRLFSRSPSIPEPLALLENDQYYVAVYSISSGYSKTHLRYEMATFKKSGKLVGVYEVGELYPETMVTFSVDAQLNLHSVLYKIQWAKDYWDVELGENAIENVKRVQEKVYNIKSHTKQIKRLEFEEIADTEALPQEEAIIEPAVKINQ
jgi:hypothetical protein